MYLGGLHRPRCEPVQLNSALGPSVFPIPAVVCREITPVRLAVHGNSARPCDTKLSLLFGNSVTKSLGSCLVQSCHWRLFKLKPDHRCTAPLAVASLRPPWWNAEPRNGAQTRAQAQGRDRPSFRRNGANCGRHSVMACRGASVEVSSCGQRARRRGRARGAFPAAQLVANLRI